MDFEGATSIDRQEGDCRRWCAAHGLSVRRVHVDRGVSGYAASAHRDGFDAALAAVVAGEVGTLVVWKLDRLSRRGVGQVGQVLDQFERVGGRLVSVLDQLDTAQPQARMIIALLSEFARAESETMGVRITSAKSAQRTQGVWLSGKPPFGYEVAPDQRLAPVEPAASTMREVFRLILAGHTLVAICHRLNTAGFRNSRGNLWTTTCLSEALRTPAYAGLTPARHVNGSGRHAAGHPEVFRHPDTGEEVSCLTPGASSIVGRAEQLRAFEILRARRDRYGRGSRPRHPAHALLLRGLGRCAGCDRPLVTHNGYRCTKTDRTGTLVCPMPANAGVQTVDRRVTTAWQSIVCTGGPEWEPLRRAVAERWTPIEKQPSRWARVRAELAEYRVRLEDADAARYVRGDLDASRHAKVTGALLAQITRTEAALRESQPDIDTSGLADPRYVAHRWQQLAPDGRRDLLRLAWDKIVIAKAGHRGGHFDPRRISYVPRSSPPDTI